MLLTEETDTLLAEMVEAVLAHGYEFEGSELAFDPDKFLEAVESLVDSDEDFDTDTAAWLKESVAHLKAQTEGFGGTSGMLPKTKYRDHVGPQGRKLVKRSATRRERRAWRTKGTQNPEEFQTPPRKTSGYAD